ncbi:MAG: T9SS type A sorting domain-containing protein [Bacteroidetes bacterium]|jgi:photosystem II stability/assembly factor-like uncharacterized protein|nr:T9SS type A sorting domain-containing protein [Bacteroidota bacterium]MBT4409435.1 T9SS type A sorting domain-containing protein [Bacteroidota bacterium]MBT7462565.1 T9SS type A sorting domain-containing protein [Bacteroidota bacterium]
MKRHIIFLLVIVGISLSTWSQVNTNADRDWHDMMLDPGTNFFETQKAFYDFWEGKTPAKGMGYSVFKRWEYYWQSRVDEKGNFPSPGQVADEYHSFLEDYPVGDGFKSGQAQWLELGPRNRNSQLGYMGIGRVNAIAFHPSDENKIYVGAPAGGFWITEDAGQNWTSYTDNLPTLGVSAIAVHPENPDHILIGTGDRDGGNDWGVGTMISLDGGISWEISNTGIGEITVGFFAHHETEPNTLLAAGNGGIFKTTDFGATWTITSSNTENYRDIKYKPGDMNVAYASSNAGFYRSEDAGETWTMIGENEGITASGRIVIGVSPASPDRVYLVLGGTFQGCFLSTDEGKTFTIRSDSPNILGGSQTGDDSRNQSWYDLTIHIDPFNANIVHVGGINTWRSDDSGQTWTLTSHWSGQGGVTVHADHHCVTYNYLNNRMYDGNDGGIYWTDNQGASWTDISPGLGIGQMYKLGVSATNRHKTLAGFQDNGSATLTDHGWYSTGGGDGFECVVDPFSDGYSYTSVYYGAITRWINNSSAMSIAGDGRFGIDESGAWVTPFGISEWDPATMAIGFKNLWISRNIKDIGAIKWQKVSDNLGGSNTTNCAVIEFSPPDSNLFYFARHDGKIFRTDNLLGNPVWEDLTDNKPVNGTPTDLEAHPYIRNTIFMTLANKVFRSDDLGESWENISLNLPNINMNDIVFDRSSDEGLYVASDAGVYYKNADMSDWSLYGPNLPAQVEVTELEIYYARSNRSDSRLKASTYGRGMWEIELADAGSPMNPPYFLNATVYENDVELSWNPPHFPLQVSGYNIYRNNELFANSSGTTFLDRDKPEKQSVSYWVTAIYPGGESMESNEAYIQAPIQLPYMQDFENGTDGWIAKFTDDGWMLGNSEQLHITGNDGSFFGISSAYAGEDIHVSDHLYTPKIDLSEYTGQTVSLKFSYALRVYRNYDKLSLVYRLSAQDDWSILKVLEGTATNSWTWLEQEIVLPDEILTEELQLGFLYDDSKQHAWGAGIDDLQLYVNTSSVYVLASESELSLYPNPNHGEFQLSMTLNQPGTVQILLYDLAGRKVWEESFEASENKVSKAVTLPAIDAGLYQFMIKTLDQEFSKTISIQ